jgi:hypothetical protein
MNLKTIRDLVIVVAVVALGVAGFRWLTAPGVGAKQAQTIDSLRVVNAVLDSTVRASNARADAVQKATKARIYRDSVLAAHRLDSLEALIPDTATMVPRPIHDAIVVIKDSTIRSLRRDLFVSDSGWSDARTQLEGLRAQNIGLMTQVNDLEGKANMNIFRRVKVAVPFVAGTYLACKLGLIKC